MKGLQVTQQ